MPSPYAVLMGQAGWQLKLKLQSKTESVYATQVLNTTTSVYSQRQQEREADIQTLYVCVCV